MLQIHKNLQRLESIDIGHAVSVFIGDGKLRKAIVLMEVQLPGYSFKHFILEISTPVDPLIVIRSPHTMWKYTGELS